MAKKKKKNHQKLRKKELEKLYSGVKEKQEVAPKSEPAPPKKEVQKKMSNSEPEEESTQLGSYVRNDLLKTLYFMIFVVIVIFIAVVLFSDYNFASQVRDVLNISKVEINIRQ